MEVLKPPSPMNFKAKNTADAWDRWEARFRNYHKAAELKKKDRDVQVAIMLEVAGPDALAIHKTFKYADDEDQLDYEVILRKFEQYCKPRKNTVFERYIFWGRDQEEGETLDQWLIDLRTQAAICEFGSTEDLMLRDKVVFGIKDPRAKERMLREGDLTLQKALDIGHAAESTQRQLEGMKLTGQSAAKQVNAVNKADPTAKVRGQGFSRQQAQAAKQVPAHTGKPKAKKAGKRNCIYCGTTHAYKKCPAYGATCGKCGYRNHFDAVCRQGTKKVQLLEAEEELDEYLVINTIYIGSLQDNWHEEMQVGTAQVNFKLDTGAQANVLPLCTLKQAAPGQTQLEPTDVSLTAFGDHQVKPLGTAILPCSYKDDTWQVKFYITDVANTPILGHNACEKMGLIKRVNALTKSLTKEEMIKTYEDVFTGLGQYETEYKIELKPEVEPVIQAPRRVPYAKQAKLREALNALEKQGVIAKVDRATDWVSNLVITEKKNGKMRICLDPRPLNKAIKRERYIMPTAADVQAQLSGCKLFTVIDMKDGFWHVKLAQESSFLCTFNTPWGRRRFCRMPFGILSASEVMQKRNYEAFGDIKGVHVIADDLIIAAVSDQEHDAILRQVMTQARQKNVKFNAAKIQYKVPEVLYMGNRVTEEGLKPDKAKVQAIQEMPEPEDKLALQRLLGMVKYLTQYIPNESSITVPLRDLLKKDTAWQWQPEHIKALEQIKAMLAKAPVLRYYDVNKEVTIQADASQRGLGACLMQQGQPVHYASRALTETESRYAQIEKEMLAICYAARKFHQYIYGKTVNVQTDHRPLEAIFKRPLATASPRLQRMQLKIQCYDLRVAYVPGKYMYLADTLSRAHLPDSEDNADAADEYEVMVHSLVRDIPVSDRRKEQLKQATAQDQDLQMLKEALLTGWPRHQRSTPRNLLPYWSVRNYIHAADGLLCMEDRIIVPESLRGEMLTLLHESHMGTEKTKARARNALYWPNMAEDIDKAVAGCTTCLRYRNAQQTEPLQPHPVPDRPWEKLGADILTCRGQDYLVVVDYYSKYPELAVIEDKTAGTVISKLKEMFARHGIPEALMSDNIPIQLPGIQRFCTRLGHSIGHIKSNFCTVKWTKRTLCADHQANAQKGRR